MFISDIAINSTTATLTQDGKTMRVQMLSPAGATFKVEETQQPATEARNTNVKNLTIRLAAKTTNVTIAVLKSSVRRLLTAPRRWKPQPKK